MIIYKIKLGYNMSKDLVEKLITLTINNKNKYPYINLDDDNNYNGWVTDFNLRNNDNKSAIKLDLHKEKDLFLLFVLATAWSKTGPWENAVFFTTYIKLKNIGVKQWCNIEFVKNEINKKNISCQEITNKVSGINYRKKISFRKDFYNSVYILANKWQEIKDYMEISSQKQNWKIFIDYISSIEGLGSGRNKMRIKIPLILRELKCQNVYPNIDGKYCCVADERVRKAYSNYLHKNLPQDYLKASEIIWNDCGTLYDIPAFACEDLCKNSNNHYLT